MGLPSKVNVGISIESNQGFVSEYEMREACLYVGHTWASWSELDSDERASCVAHWRMHLLIEAHVNEAVSKYNSSQAKSGK